MKHPHLYDPFPKYLQIRGILLRWLSTLQLGDRLPTEHLLAARFKVSRETIREALHFLEQDGTIARRPRIGTWLAKPPVPLADDRITGPVEDFASLDAGTKAVLIRQGETSTTDEVTSALKLPPGSPVFEIKRVRYFHDRPLTLVCAFFSVPIGLKMAKLDLKDGLFVPALRQIYNSAVQEQYQQIDATVAGKDETELLDIKEGSSLLLVKRLFVDAHGRPVVFFISSFRSDRYFYTVNLPRTRKAAKRPLRKRSKSSTKRKQKS